MTAAPLLVNQRTALPVLGWSSERYIAFLRRRNVPHVRDGRLFIAKTADVLRALGFDDEPAKTPAPKWSRADLIAELTRGGPQ